MNWKLKAINELKEYEKHKRTIEFLTTSLAIAESIITSPRVASCSAVPNHGGGNRYEDKLLDHIDKCSGTEYRLAKEKAIVGIVDAALEVLTEKERYVIDKYYIHRTNDYKEKLYEKLHESESSICRIKDSALRKFVYAMYGENI